ncbi:MAG: hypothetical protein ACK4R8_10670, partial [Thiobacillus sp.]
MIAQSGRHDHPPRVARGCVGIVKGQGQQEEDQTMGMTQAAQRHPWGKRDAQGAWHPLTDHCL